MNSHETFIFGKERMTIEHLVDLAEERINSELCDEPEFIRDIDSGHSFVSSWVEGNKPLYGVNTGFGGNVSTSIPAHLMETLPSQLVRYHGCGLGNYFDEKMTTGIVLARLNSLVQGYSGVSYELLSELHKLIDLKILPRIPEEGSVGASGDLTPLSYIAAVLQGDREVYFEGDVQQAADVLKALALKPYHLKVKESLALMNGTAVMTAIACFAHSRTQYLIKLGERISAYMCMALQSSPNQFSPILFKAKPHPEQLSVAENIFTFLQDNYHVNNYLSLQEAYSTRCAPHIIGALADAMPWFRQVIETELNSATDNPIINVEQEECFHGGHFYGGHIAMAMDTMKIQVANLADLFDRQLALISSDKSNRGLPNNLSASNSVISHGFKAVQIASSAWAAEALRNATPASIFSRSTECHNQDKVSMGTIAARDCIRIIELTEQCAAALYLAVSHAVKLRQKTLPQQSDINTTSLDQFLKTYPLLEEDRALEQELRELCQSIQSKTLL